MIQTEQNKRADIQTVLRILPILLVLLGSMSWSWGQEEDPKSEDQRAETEASEAQKDPGLSSYVLVEEDSLEFVPSLSVVATKTPTSIVSTPMSVGVVNEPLFNSQHAEVMGDTLRNVSGAVAHTGFGVFDYFVIRGFDSLSSGLVLYDGAPEPESAFYHLYNVERVEVLKGPGGFLYGGNPLAGSVNLVRKEPVFENFLKAGGSFGSFATGRGYLELNRTNAEGNIAFRLNAFGRRSNGYRDDKENSQIGVNPAVSFSLGQRSLLTVNFEYARNDYRPDSGLPLLGNEIPEVPRTQSYQSPFDFSDQNITRTRVDFSTFLGQSITLRNKFYFTDLDWKTDGTIFPGVLPDGTGGAQVFRSLLRLDDRQKLFGNQTEVLFNFGSGSIRNDLLTGFEVRRLGDEFTLDVALLPPIDLFNPVETAEPPLFNIPFLSQVADTRAWVLAPYVLDQISFSPKFKLTVGGRFDILDFEDDASGLTRNSSKFSPLAGFNYLPNPGLSFYVSGGQAFAPPSSQAVGDFEPEESTQFEGGVKKQFYDGSVLLTVAVYQLERKNIAIPDETGVTRQVGSQGSRGFELDLAGELAPGMFLTGSYAYTDAVLTEFRESVDFSFGQLPPIIVDRSGNRPPFAPEHIFNVFLIKEFSTGLSVGVGGQYLSSQYISVDNGFAIDPSLILDASIGYQMEHWRLRLNLKNLTNADYETRGFGATSVLPGNPLAVYLGVDFTM
jgi:TonB-dependent siderophore receptor